MQLNRLFIALFVVLTSVVVSPFQFMQPKRILPATRDQLLRSQLASLKDSNFFLQEQRGNEDRNAQETNELQTRLVDKRLRGEPIRFGKRSPREPIRFGKRFSPFFFGDEGSQ